MMLAALVAAVLGAPPANYVAPTVPPVAERTPNLYKVPERCKDSVYRVVDRYGRPLPQKLADLPKGALLYAVDRQIDGCPALVVVYGAAKPDDPNPQRRDCRVTPAHPEARPH